MELPKFPRTCILPQWGTVYRAACIIITAQSLLCEDFLAILACRAVLPYLLLLHLEISHHGSRSKALPVPCGRLRFYGIYPFWIRSRSHC